MSPAGVDSFWPRRPGEVPKTMLPPEKAWLTGVTSLDSPPMMFSTHTRSSRVAILARLSMPTKYLKPAIPCLYIRVSSLFRRRSGGLARTDAPGDLFTPARPHPAVGGLGVIDDLA